MKDWYTEHQSEHEQHRHHLRRTLFEGKTQYQDVWLTESYNYGKILILDDDIQSAQRDESYYHEMLVHPALIGLPQPPRSVLILGGGEGATAREVFRYPSVERVVMVDLDGELVKICREHMPEWGQGAFEDARLEMHHDDARAYLERCTEKFDAVIHDLPQPLVESPLRLLFTVECFGLVQKAMHPHGIMNMQSCSVKTWGNALHLLIRKTVERSFPISHTMHAYIPSFANDWGFIVGSQQSDPRRLSQDEVDARIRDRVKGELSWYCGETHQGLFLLTPDYRKAYQEQQDFLEDARPLALA